MWQSIVFGIILIVLGLIEVRSILHFAWYNSKRKKVINDSLIIYSGIAFSILFIIFGLSMILGTTTITHFSHTAYVIIGICLIIISILVFVRGRKISNNLKKEDETHFQAMQAYWIAALVLISGIVSLFR